MSAFARIAEHMEAKIAQVTPARLALDLWLTRIDVLLVLMGTIVLMVDAPAVVLGLAIAHLAVGFLQALSKPVWLALELMTFAAAAAAFFALRYALQLAGIQFPFAGFAAGDPAGRMRRDVRRPCGRGAVPHRAHSIFI
jgi:hypothetical protein